MDDNERKMSMANNRNNRFDKIREKIDKRTPHKRKVKEKDYSTENTCCNYLFFDFLLCFILFSF